MFGDAGRAATAGAGLGMLALSCAAGGSFRPGLEGTKLPPLGAGKSRSKSAPVFLSTGAALTAGRGARGAPFGAGRSRSKLARSAGAGGAKSGAIRPGRGAPPPAAGLAPRVSKVFDDPLAGLATIEAIFAAYTHLGRDTRGLLDHYRWVDRFLVENQRFPSSMPLPIGTLLNRDDMTSLM